MINRRKILVSDRYGKTSSVTADTMKKNLSNATDEFKKLYKNLSKEDKKKVSFEDGLGQAQKIADSMKTTRTLDDAKMLVRNGKDKPMHVNEFIRLVKNNINQNLVLKPNQLVGQNVGGHGIYLITNDGLQFVCGVGENLSSTINPETTFFNADTSLGQEKKIRARGYLAAIESIVSWLGRNGYPIRNRNFINEV